MYKAHIQLNNKNNIRRLEHIPNCGDTIRFSETTYGTVTEIIYCLDEDKKEGQRVNIRVQEIE